MLSPYDRVTPGPLFTTATSVGYMIARFKGAALATIAIFLPSFIFVPLVNTLVPKIRNSVLAGAALDGVNAASLGLMAAVTIQLARLSLIDPPTIVVAAFAVAGMFWLRIISTWIIAGGGAVGLMYGLN